MGRGGFCHKRANFLAKSGKRAIKKATIPECGKPSCRCAQGLRHEALAFTYKLKGRSMLLHVPKAMAREARQAAADYAKLKKLVERLSMNNLERFRLKTRKMKRRA